MYDWYNLNEGGDQDGTTGWILSDRFTNREFKEDVEEDWTLGIRDYQACG